MSVLLANDTTATRIIRRTMSAGARLLPVAALPGLLGSCQMVVLHPMGDVALQQRNLVVFSTVLMLLIVIPVIALVGIFAWRYRQSNETARYEPDWDHSTFLELVIWAAPLLIVICLGAVTWTGTHLLDPYRPITRSSGNRPFPAGTRPLEVEVVALDWKWLFIYPEYGIATVNELAAPVDRPIHLRLTSASVMNAFYVPTMAGMIYAMPSMQTELWAVINAPGNYAGFSANYSGAGFSGMRFRFYGMRNADFSSWIARNKAASATLSPALYLALEKPSQNVPVARFASVAPGLFEAVVNHCVAPGKACMSNMMNTAPGGTKPGMRNAMGAMPKTSGPQIDGSRAAGADKSAPIALPSNPIKL